MRVAFLSKRQYMRKDLLDDRYGRLFELPRQLARLGQEVLGLCLSYRHRAEGVFAFEGNLAWQSRNLGTTVVPGAMRYLRDAHAMLRDYAPDVLIGASDSPHVILAAHFAGRLGIPYLADLYDNFESFGLTRLPGVRPLYRRALRNAAGVTCVSGALARRVQSRYRPKGEVIALETVADTDLFYPRDRKESRRNLGLPLQGRLVGTAGALDGEHDIGTVYRAVAGLQKSDPDLHLILAGTPSARHPVPEGPRVHFLGALDHRLIPEFFCALDLALVPMKDSEFGRYAFPQKLHEIVACNVPVLGAAVGGIKELLRDFPACLYESGNASDLGDKLGIQLENPQPPAVSRPTWPDQALRLEELLCRITASRRADRRRTLAAGVR